MSFNIQYGSSQSSTAVYFSSQIGTGSVFSWKFSEFDVGAFNGKSNLATFPITNDSIVIVKVNHLLTGMISYNMSMDNYSFTADNDQDVAFWASGVASWQDMNGMYYDYYFEISLPFILWTSSNVNNASLVNRFNSVSNNITNNIIRYNNSNGLYFVEKDTGIVLNYTRSYTLLNSNYRANIAYSLFSETIKSSLDFGSFIILIPCLTILVLITRNRRKIDKINK